MRLKFTSDRKSRIPNEGSGPADRSRKGLRSGDPEHWKCDRAVEGTRLEIVRRPKRLSLSSNLSASETESCPSLDACQVETGRLRKWSIRSTVRTPACQAGDRGSAPLWTEGGKPVVFFALLFAMRFMPHGQSGKTGNGKVPERSKGADCKSVASASVVRIHPFPKVQRCSVFKDIDRFFSASCVSGNRKDA